MNFFASSEFLQVLADTYFPDRYARIANVAFGDRVLRLLIVNEAHVVTDVPFLDYHVPLDASDVGIVERWNAHVPWVMQSVIASEDRQDVAPGLALSPYVDWSMFDAYGNYDAFIRSRHGGSLRKLRRLRRRLEDHHGPIEFCSDDRRSDVLARALAWKSAQFHATGADDLFADPPHVRFFDNLRERNLLTASSLRIGGRLLAVALGFVHEAVQSGWILTYDADPPFSHYSPGHQLLQSMLRDSFSSKHREFDFSAGAQDFKWLYATHARVLGPLSRRQRSGGELATDALDRVKLLGAARALKQALFRAAKA